MIDLSVIKQFAKRTVNEQGQPVIQIPADLWDELLAEESPSPNDISPYDQIETVLDQIASHADDKSPEWWAEFDQFMKENRFNIPERDLGFDEQ